VDLLSDKLYGTSQQPVLHDHIPAELFPHYCGEAVFTREAIEKVRGMVQREAISVNPAEWTWLPSNKKTCLQDLA
jgi:hypothetical protein